MSLGSATIILDSYITIPNAIPTKVSDLIIETGNTISGLSIDNGNVILPANGTYLVIVNLVFSQYEFGQISLSDTQSYTMWATTNNSSSRIYAIKNNPKGADVISYSFVTTATSFNIYISTITGDIYVVSSFDVYRSTIQVVRLA